MSTETKKIERNAVVLAIKEINKELGMNPVIPTKTKKGEKIPAEELTAILLKYAKGFNDKTEAFEDDLKITRNDNLSPETFAVLEAIGAFTVPKLNKATKDKVDKGLKAKTEGKTPKAVEAKKEPKAKKVKKGGDTRDLAMLNVMTSYTGVADPLVIAYDKMLIKKQSMEAHLAEASKLQKLHKKELDLQKHIAYRTKYSGFTFAKEEGMFFLAEVDVTKAQKFKVPAINVVNTGKPTKAPAPVSQPTPAKEKAKAVATQPSKGADKGKGKKSKK